MASVSVEFHAFHDPRFRVLAKLSGFSHFDAIGRMTSVWVYAVEKNSATLSRELIDALVEVDGYSDWVIQADLAEETEENCLRIKGTEGRIEWLARARERQKIATVAARVKRERDKKAKLDPTLDPISGSPLVSTSTSTSSSKRKKSSIAPSEAPLLWDFYSKALSTNGVEPIHEGAKTIVFCQKLVKQHGLEKAKDLVRVYLADKSPFVAGKAWVLGLLVSQQQEYLAKVNSVRLKPVLTFGDDL